MPSETPHSIYPLTNIYPLANKVATDAGRTALILSYEGKGYHGWQAQRSGVPSIQAALEKALSRVANEEISVTCAGRTDAGVNATQQVVHFDAEARRSPWSWVMGGNHFLPSNVALSWAGQVSLKFHARYSATARTYRYLIYNHPLKPAIALSNISWVHQSLDAKAMHRAAQHLVGEHDFSAFRGADCQSKTPFRQVTAISVVRKADLIIIEITANAFLHHMVRNIAGTLIVVGTKKRPDLWVAEVLASRRRALAGATASPSGLYLVTVKYPAHFGLPELPPGPFFLQE